MIKASDILTHLEQRAREDWLVGYSARELLKLVQERLALLRRDNSTIVLAESDPWRFLAGFLAAAAAQCPVFLGNPDWKQEWQLVFELVQPDLIWGTVPEVQMKGDRSPPPASIMIPTGGSSGKIRFAMHTWETLTASVYGFYRYFGDRPVNSFCVLPLYHVSGLMQFLRSFLTGGRVFVLSYQALKAGAGGELDPENFFISLVPTQLQYLLQTTPQWLSRFQTVLLGGAPAWQSLLDRARAHQIRLAPTYGMTETASQIVTLKPEDFLQGNSSGQVLPHAQVTICSDAGEPLEMNQTGIITVRAESLCLGYYPNLTEQWALPTDDLGYFDAKGYLYVVGRRSRKIITGGENVFPAEVEAAIRSTQLVEDVSVVGLPDPVWGQIVVAVYVANDSSLEAIQRAMQEKLSKFKHPKRWLQVKQLPRNAQGKVNVQQVAQLVELNK